MNWERKEEILVLCLYFKLGGSALKSVNQDDRRVFELAKFLNRDKDSSVSMRVANFISVDSENPNPGLRKYAQQTKEVWDEFHADRERLTHECNLIREDKEF